MSHDLAQHLDPCLFAEACGVTPDPWQATFLRDPPKRGLILAARQVGKTTVCSVHALWVAMFTPGALVVVVSPSQRQSSEFVRTVRLLHTRLDDAPQLKTESVTKLEFKNDSRVVALPGDGEGKTVKGLANARLILVDEAAIVSDDLMQAVRPMLAVNRDGALIALTTPRGRRGWFYDSYHDTANDSWRREKDT